MDDTKSAAQAAADKMATGSLLTLDEVAARLSCAPATVHRLPLPSIRIGRLLRFDPKDVEAFLAKSREEVVAVAELGRLQGNPPVDAQQVWPSRRLLDDPALLVAQFKSGVN